jgi:hypothetical protein
VEQFVTNGRFHLGRDVRMTREDPRGIEAEGEVRLPPGRVVRLVHPGSGFEGRAALVVSWRMVRLDNNVPSYRGYCEWLDTRAQPR